MAATKSDETGKRRLEEDRLKVVPKIDYCGDGWHIKVRQVYSNP
jgi:hypothetical protein